MSGKPKPLGAPASTSTLPVPVGPPMPVSNPGAPSLPQPPAHYAPPHPPMPVQNPGEGRAAAGAAGGAVLGNLLGYGLRKLLFGNKLEEGVEVVADGSTPEEAQANLSQAEAQAKEDLEKTRRKAHTISGIVTTVCAAAGAAAAAEPGDRGRAATGAGVGAALSQIGNIAANPTGMKAPGIGLAAAGAAISVKTAK